VKANSIDHPFGARRRLPTTISSGNFDLKSLFSALFDRFYREDFPCGWRGREERAAAFQRMADALEPIKRYTLDE
jgi:hypothetical protein